MARLNTRTSTLSNATSRYQSATPQPEQQPHYDQENMDPQHPDARDKSVVRETSAPVALPTPPSAEDRQVEAGRGQKRKRITIEPSAQPATSAQEDEEKEFVKYYDPYQKDEERRDVRRRVRDLDRSFRDRRDELLQDNGSGLANTLKEANTLYSNVKQTGLATLDSRLLVDVSDLAYKKSSALVLGSNSTGVDVDEFLSKVITYMRNHGPVQDSSSTSPPQSTRRGPMTQDDGDDAEDGMAEEEPFDWEFLGRNACHPKNVRPAVRSFLLGPLSREKKQRAQTQRRARNARDANVREAKPEAITQQDLTQSDANSLTAQCKAMRKLLKKHIKDAVRALKDAGITDKDIDTERGIRLMREQGLVFVDDQVGTPLLQFVINPHSFGQTVENIFYVSFLIKEGSAGIRFDEQGLPGLFSTDPRSVETQRAEKISKHQAVISIDYGTWRDVVKAYNITTPMVPHREEEHAQLSARGWYG